MARRTRRRKLRARDQSRRNHRNPAVLQNEAIHLERARQTEARVLRFPASLFPELVQKMPELATRLVGLMSDRIREATRFEQQRDRLAALGKLSAGLAHELNNPASAAKRAASQLRDILKRVRDASHELGSRDLTAAQKVRN